VGLSGKADRTVKGFSGGEKQRLGIAQAAINDPELIILDEPASALDPLGRRDVLKILESFRGRSTVFYSTHILDDVQRVSDRVVISYSYETMAGNFPSTGWLAMSSAIISIAFILTIAILWMKRSEL
jgi:ABC-type multidrug transport system ATPase subunit